MRAGSSRACATLRLSLSLSQLTHAIPNVCDPFVFRGYLRYLLSFVPASCVGLMMTHVQTLLPTTGFFFFFFTNHQRRKRGWLSFTVQEAFRGEGYFSFSMRIPWGRDFLSFRGGNLSGGYLISRVIIMSREEMFFFFFFFLSIV